MLTAQVYNRDTGNTCFQVFSGGWTTAHNCVFHLVDDYKVRLEPQQLLHSRDKLMNLRISILAGPPYAYVSDFARNKTSVQNQLLQH